RHRQVEDRDGRPANVGHAAHHRVGLGQQRQLRALQHLPDLEHIDAVELIAIEAKQQQLQAVLPHQLRALVDRIHNTSHARLLHTYQPMYQIGTGFAFLSVMYTKTTFSRRLTHLLTGSLAALCLLAPGARTLADAFTLPEQLIGVTQGFLEFAVEDYLATSQTPGRYEIQVNSLDPRLRMPLCSQQLDASLESPAQPLGRVTVRLRCNGSGPWTV